jgi:hypothetical protein
MPPFENVVAEKKVAVTPEQMTCGLRSQNEYCIQVKKLHPGKKICIQDAMSTAYYVGILIMS